MSSLTALLPLLAAVPAQTRLPELPATADERRAAVEQLLTPRPWAEGHAFGIEERMHALNVPGVSVAVIHEGQIDWAAGYGVRDAESGEPVTTETVFQAASISKPVSAMLVLRLAQEGKLDLDAPINDLLKSWQLPEASFEGEVTPRHLLSHTAGLNVHGFPGYRAFDPVPEAVDVLNGSGFANTDAVRRVEPLGQQVRYSGGGSTVMQLALCDLEGKDFATLMAEHVLGPLEMTRSTFAQPLPTKEWPDHSAAHGWDGRVVPGRFHAYPEQYPAGLWTTPSDLARFTMELQRGLKGEEGRVLSSAWAQRMAEVQSRNSALGLFLDDFGGEPWFGHGGSNAGFKCQFYGSLEGGRGVAVMTNGDQGSELATELYRAVARVYGWPGFVESPLESIALAAEDAAAYTGRFGFAPDEMVFVRSNGEDLELHYPPSRPTRLVPSGEHEFLLFGSGELVSFHVDEEGAVGSLSTSFDSAVRAKRLEDYESWPVEDLLAGDIERGIDFYRELHGANPADPMVERDRLIQQAAGHWNSGRLEVGLAVAQLACELFPKDAGAWDTLGQLRASHGESEPAAVAYQNCLDLLPADPLLDAGDRAWMKSNSESMLRGLKP